MSTDIDEDLRHLHKVHPQLQELLLRWLPYIPNTSDVFQQELMTLVTLSHRYESRKPLQWCMDGAKNDWTNFTLEMWAAAAAKSIRNFHTSSGLILSGTGSSGECPQGIRKYRTWVLKHLRPLLSQYKRTVDPSTEQLSDPCYIENWYPEVNSVLHKMLGRTVPPHWDLHSTDDMILPGNDGVGWRLSMNGGGHYTNIRSSSYGCASVNFVPAGELMLVTFTESLSTFLGQAFALRWSLKRALGAMKGPVVTILTEGDRFVLRPGQLHCIFTFSACIRASQNFVGRRDLPRAFSNMLLMTGIHLFCAHSVVESTKIFFGSKANAIMEYKRLKRDENHWIQYFQRGYPIPSRVEIVQRLR